MFINSLNNPLFYSLSSLDYKENYGKIIKMYKTIFNYSLFIFLFITGILFIISDFFLSFIYGEIYVEYSSIIKLMLVSMAFSIYPMLFGILLRTTNEIKILAIMLLIFFPFHVLIVFTGLILYGIHGMYYAYIITNVLLLICDSILTVKLLKIKLDFFKTIFQYFAFFIATSVVIVLENLILTETSYQFWLNSNLSIFKHLNLFSILIFVFIFLFVNVILKTITRNEIEYIEMLFTKDSVSHKYINKLLRFLKKFLRG